MSLKKEEALWTWGVRAQSGGARSGVVPASFFGVGVDGPVDLMTVPGNPSRKWNDPFSAPGF